MEYVWAFYEAMDDPNTVPPLYSSKKKAMCAFNNEVNFAKDRGLKVIVTNTEGVASASWTDNEG